MNQDDRVALTRLEEQMKTLFNRFDDMEQHADKRFDKIEEKLGNHDDEMTKLKIIGAKAGFFFTCFLIALGALVNYFFDLMPHR